MSSNGPTIERGTRWRTIRREVLRSLAAVVVALAVAFIIILCVSKAPLDALNTLLTAPIGRVRTIGQWIDDAAKLTVTGLAFSLVFQARQFSMGVQGQVYVGALAAAWVAMSPLGASFAAIPLGVAAAMLAGAIYGFIPGYAKAKFGANEIVSSLMLNYIAIELCTYLVRNFMVEPGSGKITSNDFPAAAVFPPLIDKTRIDLGLIFALVAVAVVWFALYRTRWGLKLRLVGHNPQFAAHAGIKPKFIMVTAMTASGALGGLLGSMFVQGQAFGNITILFEGNLAFEGILVAIVARARPLAVPFVALFYGYLRQGAQLMNIRSDVPAEVIGVVTAIIILLVSSSFSLGFIKRLFRRGRAAPAANPAMQGAAK